MPDNVLAEKHSFIQETSFQFKTALFIIKRGTANVFSGIKRYDANNTLIDAPVVAISESALWNNDDHELNWILTAGKVENLRIAARLLNKIEIPAGKIFSFWKFIGNPNLNKGFVIGREIREGCIVPTRAGGLCQLSNALYDAALKAGFTIVERHKHTRVIKGSLAEQDRDATVKWNYVDLRFKSKFSFRIEIDLSADKLIVKLRSVRPDFDALSPIATSRPAAKLNDCFSCGNYQCFKNPGKTKIEDKSGITGFVLDERWPELNNYVSKAAAPGDSFIAPFFKHNHINIVRYTWNVPANKKSTVAPAAYRRALILRLFRKTNKNVFQQQLKGDQRVALAAVSKIPVAATHLVLSQNLLPFLWEQGVLGGRTFDVLMTRLPIAHLHQRLDDAHIRHPFSCTLNDFRAPQTLIDAENAALTNAAKIVTPHAEIAAIFNNKTIRLEWQKPGDLKTVPGEEILFPASALGRKGAYEMRRLAKELGLRITIAGNAIEEEGFWGDINTRKAGINPLANIALVIYPTYIEHRPGLLLRAIAAGIPVITTPASGLSSGTHITIITTGDYDALKQAVQQYVNIRGYRQPAQA